MPRIVNKNRKARKGQTTSQMRNRVDPRPKVDPAATARIAAKRPRRCSDQFCSCRG